jgi:hypothetical protein
LVWVEDHEGSLPHPAQDQAQSAARSISPFFHDQAII